jgi:hypothetical protein
MKHIASAILILLCLSAVAFGDGPMTATDPESLGFSTTRLARIASWYQAHVEAGDLPGAVVAIARNGKLAYLKGIGFQDRSKTIPMNPDAIFWIASMTKPVTSVAAMMLVEEGKLDLDAPVARYLPALEGMQVAREVVDPVTGETTNFMLTQLVPQKHPMTVRDLLRHTSGLVYPPQYNSAGIHRLYGAKAVFTRNTTLTEFVASLAKLPLAHQPGEVWEYSWGVDVLARGRNVAFVYRWTDGKRDLLPQLAADLMRSGVTLIVASADSPTALAAMAAAPRIPVLFLTEDDPVRFGLVASLDRPGGRATGLYLTNPRFDVSAASAQGELRRLLVSYTQGINLVIEIFDTSSVGMKTDPEAAFASNLDPARFNNPRAIVPRPSFLTNRLRPTQS